MMRAKPPAPDAAIVLLLGSNMGNRMHFINQAKEKLVKKQIFILKESSFYETAAWGNANQEAFLNQAIIVKTNLKPLDLLNQLLVIENEFGRERNMVWEPRTIDIDILFYNNLLMKSDLLTIPHPRISERKFTLVPLAEMLPDYIHPVFQITIKELLNQCTDVLSVKKVEKAWL